MIHGKTILLVAAGWLTVALPQAHAQDTETDLYQRLLECRAVESALERLDCFDQATRELERSDAEDTRERGSAAREQARQRAQEQREQAQRQREDAQQTAAEAREQASSDFGREHRSRSGDDIQYVEITESWQSPRGLWRFRMEDGSEWHQTQNGRFQFDEDETYFIRRGALNSFMLGQESSNRTIRVRRVD